MTQQLLELAQWLAEAKVTAVAMEATGIYWCRFGVCSSHIGSSCYSSTRSTIKQCAARRQTSKTEKGSPSSSKMDDLQAVMYRRWRDRELHSTSVGAVQHQVGFGSQ